MKRLNEKGFATSSILYSLLILFVFLALGVLALFANSKMVFDKMKTDMLASLNGVDKVVITPNAEYVVADFGSKDDILSTYFNFRLIGESPILTKVCIDKSRSDTQVVNVEELSIGQHEIECTIIKENGYSKSATINITIDSDYICSSVTNTTGGKIAFGDYLLGDEYECNPGDGIGRRFYVIGSNYNNVSLIMNKNIGDNIEYDASGGNLLKEAETQLVSKTNNWNSVTVSFPTKDQIMTAILGSSPSTYDEYWFHKPNFEWILTNTNCLNRSCSDEGTTDTTLGYWISGNVSSGKAWTVDYASMFIKENTNRITKGVRPVITVNKTDIYNALEAIDIPSITVTPSSGWSPSKNVTILFPARMYEVDYEYSTNGINWITLDASERTISLPFTEDGYVVARMMVDDKLIHSVTTNIGNIDTNYPTIVANMTSGIEVKDLNLDIFSSYVTATNVGQSPVLSKVCTDTNHGSVIVTNVNQMSAIGAHNLRCTITKENGLSKSVDIVIDIINKEYVYNYSGTYTTFTVPKTGYYLLETWGASGGNDGVGIGANGGYSVGYKSLTKDTVLYVYVGGQGVSSAVGTGGGYNGGGHAGATGSSGGGGGASDIRTSTALANRIIVAGGGGGAGNNLGVNMPPGHGGGTSGGHGNLSTTNGATNTAGGTSVNCNGSLGQGANHSGDGGGGGGGYYGGGSGNGDQGGGGGSGYIGGVTYGTSIPGNIQMPTISSGIQTGNVGNGAVRITYVDTVYPILVVNKPAGIEVKGLSLDIFSSYITATSGDSPVSSKTCIDTNHGSITVTNVSQLTDIGVHNLTCTVTRSDSSSKSENISIEIIDKEYVYEYNGNYRTFTAKKGGYYKLEVWGAQGGHDSSSLGANGGYSVGYTNMIANQVIYIYVGGQGATGSGSGGGYNGGGHAGSTGSSGGGGGASDIRVVSTALANRIIVAGGGGGGGLNNGVNIATGYGGGTSGGHGNTSSTNGATSGAGGTSANGNGSLGQGANHSGDGGGGGGGYYGGGAGNGDQGGGGGSGYIGGVTGATTTSGARSGNGYAKITFMQ